MTYSLLDRAPPPRPARRRRRRGRRARHATCSTASRLAEGDGHAERRAAAAHRDTGRRRAWQSAERIGFIGLGIMGSRQAANLRRAGYELTVWNRTRATADAWAQEHGATVADTPAEVARRSDIVITMVVDGAQVERGAARRARRRRGRRTRALLCVDMSTIAPADDPRASASALAERGIALPRRAGHRLLAPRRGRHADDHGRRRAPRTSSAPAAARGHGRADRPRRRRSATARWSSSSTTPSPPPTPHALAQALLVGAATGVDLDALVQVMGAGSGGSAHARRSRPARCASTTTRRCSSSSTCSRTCACASRRDRPPACRFRPPPQAREVLSAGMGRGLGDADFAAIIEVLEGLAGRRL